MRKSLLNGLQGINHPAGVPMGRIHNNRINVSGHEFRDTVQHVWSNPNRRRNPEATKGVYVAEGLSPLLINVAVGNQAKQGAVCPNHRKLLNFTALQYHLGLLHGSAVGSGDQTLGGHYLTHPFKIIVLKAQVAVRDNANQSFLGIYHRNTPDSVLRHQSFGFANGRARGEGHRV